MKPFFSSSLVSSLGLTPRKRSFLGGAALLTATGMICRVLGFFYRIFMSRTIGAEGLGLYNMVHPVFSICFSLCAGSIQTALSQYVAAHPGQVRRIFRISLAIALSLSGLLSWGIWTGSDFLAGRLLLEPRCSPYLPVMAISVPFAALHACINGCYYGMQKARVPAFSQVAEQVIRMSVVFLTARFLIQEGRAITVSLAVYGHLIGEIASAGFTAVSLCLFPPDAQAKGPSSTLSFREGALPLMALALPLMTNRLVLNLLGSAEAVWIPNRLMAFGLSNSQALAVYGVLTSMALPFILFPSALTNSIAVLMLPAVAQAQADGRRERISSLISMCLRYSCYMGILCVGIFTLFGETLGTAVFQDPAAGAFICVLAWLCPFMYLATTLGSVLNGLGKTSVTFIQNVCAMVIRLAFVLFAVPSFGILGCLWGMLASELALAAMCLISLRRLFVFSWDCGQMILKPVCLLLISIGLWLGFSQVLPRPGFLSEFFQAALDIGLIVFFYLGLLLLFHKSSGKKA